MSGGMKLFSLFGELGIQGTEEAEKQLKDVSTEGKKTKNSLSKSFQEIGTKAGELGKSMALGLAGVVTGAIAMVEGTRELRQGLGRLEAGFEGVGLTTETARETFKNFYSILGDEGTAIEASNLLKELAKDEQSLAEWTEVATGVYARFPDSIPIEGLIESANETAKVGAITGSLADALNWASASSEDWKTALGGNQKALKAFNGAIKEGASVEDAFNEALAKCNSETEREELLRSTMNTLYGESAKAYKETNKGIIDNYNAQAELNLKMAEMAEKIEPIITKGKIFLAEVLIKLEPVLNWLIDNINIIAPLVIGFLGTLFAMNLVSKIGKLKVAIQGIMLLFKTNLVALAIMAVITAIVLLIQNWDTVKAKIIEVWNKIVELWGSFTEWFKTTVIDPVVNFFTAMWESITTGINNFIVGAQAIWTAVVVWVDTYIVQPIIGFFTGLWEAITTVWNGIVLAFQIAIGLITSIIDAFIQIVLLPFTFIWQNWGDEIKAVWNAIVEGIKTALQNMKDAVVTAWNAIVNFIVPIVNKIKETISNVFNAIKTTITTIWENIKTATTTAWNAVVNFVTPIINKIKETITTVFNAIKTTVTNVFNAIKNTATTVWNNITTAVSTAVEKVKTNVAEKFNAVKTTVTTIFDGIKTKVTSVWDGITTKISTAIEKAKNAVKTAIDKIKGFFDFNVSLPSIKLPKFSITPDGWKLGDLLEGSIPKLGITWNAEGAIFKQPTIFNTRAGLQGVGEAGAEAIAPIDKLMGYTRQAVSESNYGLAEKLDVLIDLLGAYLPTMSNRQVVLSTGEVVGALVDPLDRALADLTEDRRRGR